MRVKFLEPRPSTYWGELVERDGVPAALQLAMSRISLYSAQSSPSDPHLQETLNLLYEIDEAVRRG